MPLTYFDAGQGAGGASAASRAAQESAIDCVRCRLKEYLSRGSLGSWLDSRVSAKYEPFYASIDLRDAGFKLAPVDANLYPAGFNNICPEDLESSPEILKPLLKRHLGFMPKRVAILPESHTKNRFYADNLYELRQLFRRLGIATEIGWYYEPGVEVREHHEADPHVIELETSDGRKLDAYPFRRVGNRLLLSVRGKSFDPEFILINNDFSSGFPSGLAGIEQPIEPSPRLGWHTRKKSDFFDHYNALASRFAAEAGIDPWCMHVNTRRVSGVDFTEGVGMDKIASAVDEIIEKTRAEYDRRGIDETPFAFIKSNAGTYGMGIMRVESGVEILKLNRRERNKMAVVKNRLTVRDVIVQEGIPTRFKLDGVYAEPVIYLMGRELMGGFLRKNPQRGRGENLNSRGMVFQKLCLSDLRHRAARHAAPETSAARHAAPETSAARHAVPETSAARHAVPETGADRDLELEMVYGTVALLSVGAMSFEVRGVEQI
ncbi:MAG: glutamate--cysteine ligase [Deltaproteobacteria bacterium]|nr:glutamate--cysteine ligase [Deltaproteobacteria bacterium]